MDLKISRRGLQIQRGKWTIVGGPRRRVADMGLVGTRVNSKVTGLEVLMGMSPLSLLGFS